MKKFLFSIFFTFTIIVLILLTYKIYSYKQSKLYNNITSLHKIKEIDLSLNQNILKSKYSIIKNYDLFSQIVKDLDQELIDFELNSHNFFMESESSELIEKLSELILLKKNLIEKFKPNDSILKIGLTDLNEKVQLLKKNERNSFFEIDSILHQVYLEQKNYEISDLLNLIDSKRKSLKSQNSNQILSQAEIILLKQKEQSEIIESIISLPSEFMINRLINLSNHNIEKMQRSINIMRLIIGFLGIILVLVTLTNLIQLKISEISLSSLNKNLLDQVVLFEKFFPKNFLESISNYNLKELQSSSILKKEMILIFVDLKPVFESVQLEKKEIFNLMNEFYKTSFSYIKKNGGLAENFEFDKLKFFLEPESDKYLNIIFEIQDFFAEKLKLKNFIPILLYKEEFEFAKLGELSNFTITNLSPDESFFSEFYKLSSSYSVPIFTNKMSLPNSRSNKNIEIRKLDSILIEKKEFEIYELISFKDELFSIKKELKEKYEKGLFFLENRKLKEAKKELNIAQKISPTDIPTKLLLKKTSGSNSKNKHGI